MDRQYSQTYAAIPLDRLGGHSLSGEMLDQLIADLLKHSLELGATRGFDLCSRHVDNTSRV
jgi:hypothetical protein